MKCANCPVDGDRPCLGLGVPRFCELVDPSHKSYNPDYIKVLQDGPRPTIMQKAANFTTAVVKHTMDGFDRVSKAAQDERLAICDACPKKSGDECTACGCPLSVKTSWASEECPMGLWGVVGPEGKAKGCSCG